MRPAEEKSEACETRLQHVIGRRKPELIDHLGRDDTQRKWKRTATHSKCQVIAHQGAMLGREVPRNGGFVMPNVHTPEKMNFPVPVEQTNGEVHFF
jgi:hypothetical protein